MGKSVNPVYYQWSFSIAMLNYQAGYSARIVPIEPSFLAMLGAPFKKKTQEMKDFVHSTMAAWEEMGIES